MAGAVVIPDESTWSDKQRSLILQFRDSKKISPKKREKLAEEIKELIPYCGVGIVSAHEINENGIQWANIEAFRRAVNNTGLDNALECRLLIDGSLSIKDWSGEQEIIVEGDAQYMAIAGASILAKVEHDKWIRTYCEEHPECEERYNLLGSKGYGTAKHREGIRIYGGHELHRVLYIQNWLPDSTYKAKPKKKNVTVKDTEQCLIKFSA
jgi:ribonuclease HII